MDFATFGTGPFVFQNVLVKVLPFARQKILVAISHWPLNFVLMIYARAAVLPCHTMGPSGAFCCPQQA